MTNSQHPSKALHVSLWVSQTALALLYLGTGVFKLVTPLATLAALWPWVGQHPDLLRITGLVDMVGGVGIVLPALLHFRPALTVLAAGGLAALQGSAIAFHLARGEGANTLFNVVLLALALFVWAGRRRVPIAPRR